MGLNNNFFMQQALPWLVGSCPHSRPHPGAIQPQSVVEGLLEGRAVGGKHLAAFSCGSRSFRWVTRLLILGSRLTTPIPWPCLVGGPVGHQFNSGEEWLLAGRQKSAERGRNCLRG